MPPAKKPNPLAKATNVDTRIGNATVPTIISHRKLTKAVFLPTINKIPYECWSDGKEGELGYVIKGNRLASCAWFSDVSFWLDISPRLFHSWSGGALVRADRLKQTSNKTIAFDRMSNQRRAPFTISTKS